jgi:anhydro-N-acetylmuramic acid kinase
MEQIFIGLMSGTSLDGIDAIVIDLTTQPKILARHYQPYDTNLRRQIQQLCQGCPDELRLYSELDTRLGRDFASAANTVREKAGLAPQQIRAIGSHGQTIRHYPDGDYPNSLQIGNPCIIAEQTGIITITDFRRRDIAAGGQGAPLVPAFHKALFQSSENDRIIINIGGIANLTLLPAAANTPITGWDTGPGNTLMNAWILQHKQETQDTDGHWCAQGSSNQVLLDKLLTDPYFQQSPPKSTGPEHFNLSWLEHYLTDVHDTAVNVQATLCELTTSAIARTIQSQPLQTRHPEIFICGGGSHNPQIMQQLRSKLNNNRIETTLALGIDPDWVEAAAFAWLAQQTLNGKTGNLPDVTGADKAVILGGIYPV